MNPTYDVIVIGAGSVGVPAAMHLAAAKLKVLVIDSTPSAGQGQNKRAIGGIRATHSDEAKILACQQSLSIFSSWEETHGDNIEWQQGGYSYPAYNEETEKSLKDLLKIQKSFDLDIAWIGPDEYSELVPGIARENLRGSTYSPGDGSASPMLAGNAFYRKSLGDGAAYHFGERVVDIIRSNGKVTGVQTDQGRYCAKYVVNAAGAQAGAISRMAGLDLPVRPDCHEGGITEPVQPFFKPMVVDLRKAPGSKNFYFYQNREGQVVFCITPDPPIWGIDEEETSQFLPMVARRMIELFPKLKNLKVRRTWRGMYPMTPDGSPIVGEVPSIKGFVNAVGMCGQGFMLGPGLGTVITHIVLGTLSPKDQKILNGFSLERDFNRVEMLK